MTAAELGKIKSYQREFKELFGKRLEIDIALMNGSDIKLKPVVEKIIYKYQKIMRDETDLMEKFLQQCVMLHGADMQKVKSKHIRCDHLSYRREKRALIDYSKGVFEQRFNVSKAAAVINRDRTMLYHFAKTKLRDV
jgi:hypothetical protein